MIDTAAATRDVRRRRALPLPVLGTALAVVVILAIAAVLILTIGRGDAEGSATLGEAQTAFESGDFAGAEKGAAELVAADADDVEARTLLALSLAAQGKNEDAVAQYVAITKLDPKNHAALYSAASIEQLIGKAQDAIAHLEAAVALEPDPQYFAALAPLYATVGRWEDCVSAWQQYLAASELSETAQAEVYASIASAYENDREYERAKEALGQALFLDPNNAGYKARLEGYGS